MPEKNHKILEKSIKMLEYVSRNQGVTLTDICNAVEIPKSSAHLLLSTFVNMNYMRKDPKTGIYTLDVGAFELGSRFVDNNDFYRSAREILEAVVAKIDETTHLAVLDGTNAVYICKHESSQSVRMVSFIGKLLPAHASAIGKALLSGYTDEKIRDLYAGKTLERFTENTITDLDALISQLDEVRRTGFAMEREESSPGVECIAVPIVSRFSGATEAALSVSVPISRSRGNLEQYQGILLEAKRSLEIML